MQLVIMRSYIEVPQSAAGLFELLSSAEGAKILDDTTNHTDAPLEILHWQDRRATLLSLTCAGSQSFFHMRAPLRLLSDKAPVVSLNRCKCPYVRGGP